MKQRFLLMGAALVAAPLFWFAQNAQSQNAELVAYWDFNDASNPTVATDKILGLDGSLENGAVYSGDGLGHTLQPGDQALDLGMTSEQQMLLVEKGGFLNVAAADDTMSFSFWEMWWDGPVSSSAFWAVSPSSSSAQRGFQAHVPWGNSNIYFDTAGCCDGGTQRINADYTTFPGYFDGFWLEYHHFVFLKDGPTKRIYIDGQLFLEGENTGVLPLDFTRLVIGAQGGAENSIHGVIDDFAVFGSALSEADIAALAGGTAPDQLPGVQLPAEPFLLSANPTAGPGNLPNVPIAIEIFEGATPITPDSVQLFIDDTLIPEAQVTKSGKTTTVAHQPAALFGPRSSHTIRIDYNDGEPGSFAYDFEVVDYGILTAADQVTADTSKPGFIWNIHQGTDNENSIARAERQLAGLGGLNQAFEGALGSAIDFGTAGATPELPIRFEIATVINMESEGLDAGEFNPNDMFPGIDGGSDAGFDGTAAEVVSYVDLPAGLNQLIVNSDDGFQTTAGQINDVLRRQVAGQFDGGRGAADTLGLLYAQEAGVYPVRTVYFQGGGGASLEIKMVKADGTHVLLNDTANGSVPSYRAMIGDLPAAITRVSPAPDATGVDPDAKIEVTIEETSTPVDAGSIKLTLDGVKVLADVSKSGKVTTVSYQPAERFASEQTVTATITFSAGAERTDEWQFTGKAYYPNTLVAYWPFNDASTPDTSLDVVGQVPGALMNGAAFTPDGGGFTGLAGDRAIDFGVDASEQLVDITDVGFLAKVMERDQVTVSFWHKATASGVNQSAVWFVSPSSNGNLRGLGAQTPWSNNGIYYDTAGCCNGGTQRINRSITEFEDYVDDSFWLEWHHYVLTKNGTLKQIYIDGKLFHQGNNTSPLPDDFTEVLLGAEPATGDPLTHNNSMQGFMDDVSIFANELSAEDIAQLAAGTSPLDLVPEAPPGFTSIALSGGKVRIEWDGGLTLESAPSVNGPWADVAGAASPYETAPDAALMFYRLKQ